MEVFQRVTPFFLSGGQEVLGIFQDFRKISRLSEIFQDLQECSRVSKNFRSFKIFRNISVISTILKKIS
jgi:hypothetical protein